MPYSKSINIFLPTGLADGPIELEMLNWNGVVIKIPRKEVSTYEGAELAAMEEFADNVNMLMGAIGYSILESSTGASSQESRYFDLLEKLKESGVIENGTFIKEYTFSSPTAAADIVTQSYVSGNEYWSDENGKKLKEYNI